MKQAAVIDFVIPWVDGGDPEWQKDMRSHLAQKDSNVMIDASETRYRDWDNLRYWFRAVDAYAPWVNKVHFVTCGQKPAWLNLDAPKLHFVRHEDYIPEKYLPTFNSHAIELNMHRIEGLSEQFVYFNDDLFLTAPVRPEDFFVKGLPCDYLEESPATFYFNTPTNGVKVNNIVLMDKYFSRKAVRKELWRKLYAPCDLRGAIKNASLGVLNDSLFFGLKAQHLTQAYLKSTFQDVWNAEEEYLWEVTSHKFRDERDVNQYLFKFWQLLKGRFHPYNMRNFGSGFNINQELEEICSQIITKNNKIMVLFDQEEMLDFEYAKARINGAFETVLPKKSSFEL